MSDDEDVNDINNIALAKAESFSFKPPAGKIPSAEDVDIWISLISSGEKQLILEGFTNMKNALRRNTESVAELVFESSMLDLLVEVCNSTSTDPDFLQTQAVVVEALSSVASTSHDNVEKIMDPILLSVVRHLSAPCIPLVESAIWTLGNIAGDCMEFRNKVIAAGALTPLLTVLNSTKASNLLRTGAWTLSNLVRGGHFPDSMLEALPTVIHLLQCNDEEVQCDALWALTYMSDGQDSRQETIATFPGAVQLIIAQMKDSSLQRNVPALRTCGNLLSGPDSASGILLANGVLEAMKPLLTHSRAGIRKEAYWSFSNVCGGNADQVHMAVESGMFEILVNKISIERQDVLKEAHWCVVNACAGGSNSDIVRLLTIPGFFHRLMDIFSPDTDPHLLDFCITGFTRVVAAGETLSTLSGDSSNPYLALVTEDILDVIEVRRTHGSEPASILLDKYLPPIEVGI